jgi:hypothetical protein
MTSLITFFVGLHPNAIQRRWYWLSLTARPRPWGLPNDLRNGDARGPVWSWGVVPIKKVMWKCSLFHVSSPAYSWAMFGLREDIVFICVLDSCSLRCSLCEHKPWIFLPHQHRKWSSGQSKWGFFVVWYPRWDIIAAYALSGDPCWLCVSALCWRTAACLQTVSGKIIGTGTAGERDFSHHSGGLLCAVSVFL